MTTRFETFGGLCVAGGFVELLRRHDLLSFDAMMSCESGEVLDKPGLPAWRRRLRVELSDGNGRVSTLFVKRYRSPPADAQRARVLSGGLRHGTAWAEWRWMRRLEAGGVGCAVPVAFGESMRGWRELGSVVVAEAAAGESLESWANGREERCPRPLVDSLADFVRRFHRLGFFHRDLYLCHIFHDAGAQDGAGFRLIDLQRVIQPMTRVGRWRVKDLAALDFSTPASVANAGDRVRFLRRYLGVRRLGKSGKRLARRVAMKSRAIAAHDARRNARYGVSAGRSA